jgi:hypothetical protein
VTDPKPCPLCGKNADVNFTVPTPGQLPLVQFLCQAGCARVTALGWDEALRKWNTRHWSLDDLADCEAVVEDTGEGFDVVKVVRCANDKWRIVLRGER